MFIDNCGIRGQLTGIDFRFTVNYMLTKKDIERLKNTFTTKEDLKPIMKSLQLMHKKLDLTISYFDHDLTDHSKRIKRIENHLNLPPVAD